MKRLLPLVIILFIGILVVSFAGCSKESEDKLGAAHPCDTTAVSYSTGVVPILQDNCYSCHGANSNAGSGGITLEGYNNIKAQVNAGYVIGNVTHAAGFVAMPYGKPKLPDCEVNTIVAWVHQGAINN
jgi:uncharacterized membrane protein